MGKHKIVVKCGDINFEKVTCSKFENLVKCTIAYVFLIFGLETTKRAFIGLTGTPGN